MSAEGNYTVLITGANRGIGRGLAEKFISRPNHTVIGAVRDFESDTSRGLKAVQPASGSRLVLVKIENTSDTDAAKAVEELKAQGITSLDLVIANAGISGVYDLLADTKMEDFRRMFDVNTCSVMSLIIATLPLLKATVAAKGPGSAKFVAVSSGAARINDLEENISWPHGSYGASKIAVNYIVRRLQFEEPWLTAFCVNPGFADTDMGRFGAKHFGLEKAWVSVEDSVNGLFKIIDEATREETSGYLWHYSGSRMNFELLSADRGSHFSYLHVFHVATIYLTISKNLRN